MSNVSGNDRRGARWERYLETDTRSDPDGRLRWERPRVSALTILSHSDPARVGECAWLDALPGGGCLLLSRLEPRFSPCAGGEVRPLIDPRLSRSPIRLGEDAAGRFLETGGSSTRLAVDGEPWVGRRPVTDAELDRGLVLVLGETVALCWHWAEPVAQRPPSYGLVGESDAIVRLRRRIERVSDLDVAVLIRGESGTGKELIATALQRHSPRRRRRFSSLNLGAVPSDLAAAELFGVVKGAFSGADRDRPGYFREADGGTLFLDEIGAAPLDVQGLLLRALESGEIQPVGGSRDVRVDVRILAATDCDLEQAVETGRFLAPLLHRLQGFELIAPPLRERFEDLGRLFFHFLTQVMETMGEPDRLRNRGPLEPAYVPARLLAELARHSWPGNARELFNVARQLAIASRGEPTLRLGKWRPDGAGALRSAVEGTVASPDRERPNTTPPAVYRDPESVGDEELRRALRSNDWNVRRTASALGVSRGSLYALIERVPGVHTASGLARKQIERAIQEHGEDLNLLARSLEVSKHGLKRRLRDLGMR